MYDTYANRRSSSGWLVFGGTSVASPIVAGVYALAGNAGSATYGSYSYEHTSSLFDVTSGSNGSCGGLYLCTAGPGYDGPTGNGTPNGTSGFLGPEPGAGSRVRRRLPSVVPRVRSPRESANLDLGGHGKPTDGAIYRVDHRLPDEVLVISSFLPLPLMMWGR